MTNEEQDLIDWELTGHEFTHELYCKKCSCSYVGWILNNKPECLIQLIYD